MVHLNRVSIVLSAIILCSTIFTDLNLAKAQPSGGPYGPVAQTYAVPKTKGKVFFVSTTGDAKLSGETVDKPTTIESAVKQAKTGDAIIMKGGTYRTGNLITNQGISMQPYLSEQVVLKGTNIATEWKPLRENIWVTNWKQLFPMAPEDWWQRHREGMYTPLHKFNNDMVFIDGNMLHSAGWEGEVDKNSFFINYETGEVFIGTDPTNRLVEITAFDVAIHRIIEECNGMKPDKKGITLKGITFSQYAYRAIEIDGHNPEGVSPESEHGKDVVGTLIENCEISYCSRVAAYLRGDSLTVRNCKVSHTSTEGIYVLSSSDVLLERNIVSYNNIENITGYYPAAVKIFNQCYRVTCNDNLIVDHPHSNGIWYDVGNVDGVFTNNWVENIGILSREFNKHSVWPGDNGFFFEISKGVLVAGNVFINCEHSFLILNSSDAIIYNNTFYNSTACFGRDGRSAENDHFGWHPASGPDVDERDGHVFSNNIMVADKNFPRPLLHVWQPNFLCEKLNLPQLEKMESNYYFHADEKTEQPLIMWCPDSKPGCQASYNSVNELNAVYPQFEKSSYSAQLNSESVYKSPYVKNFSLLKPYTATKIEIPQTYKKVKNLNPEWSKFAGAYPVKK